MVLSKRKGFKSRYFQNILYDNTIFLIYFTFTNEEIMCIALNIVPMQQLLENNHEIWNSIYKNFNNL